MVKTILYLFVLLPWLLLPTDLFAAEEAEPAKADLVVTVPWALSVPLHVGGIPDVIRPTAVEWEASPQEGELIFENISGQRITAWALKVTRSTGTGSGTDSLLVQDVALGDSPWFHNTLHDQRVPPGDDLRLPAPLDFQSPGFSLSDTHQVSAAIEVVVFNDTSYRGDPEVARTIFGNRASAVRKYRASLSEIADPDEREVVDKVISVLERHTPSAFLDPAPPGVLRDLGTQSQARPDLLTYGSCELTTSKSTKTENGCTSVGDADILVTETWTHTCQSPYEGHGQTDRLTGEGSCLAWKECWPIFQAPIESYKPAEAKLTWSRTVDNQVSTLPFTRCLSTGTTTLKKECPCPEGQATSCSKLALEPNQDHVDTCDDGSGGGTTVCTLDCSSPIVVDLAGNGLGLTGLDDPVRFDLDADGVPERLGWTAASTEDAFLALDRNGNGKIDTGRELFGTFSPQPDSPEPNGFVALAVFDANNDLWVNELDPMFEELLLWVDRNHDGVSQSTELSRVVDSSIRGLSTRYHETRREDRHGNAFRWSSLVQLEQHRKLAATDVVFVSDDED